MQCNAMQYNPFLDNTMLCGHLARSVFSCRQRGNINTMLDEEATF